MTYNRSIECKTMEKKGKTEELRIIYEEFDDEGKEKAISVVEEYLSANKTAGEKGKMRAN